MPDASGTSHVALLVQLTGTVTVSTALLPATARRGVDGPVRMDQVRALDAVHDHVLRQLGDVQRAAVVVADVALRASARVRDGATRPSRVALLREAHARMAVETRTTPRPALVKRLAGDGDSVAATTLVEAMAVPGGAGAALLDLTTRHGLDLTDAAEVIGLDHRAAAATRTEALRQVRAHVADAGVGLDVDVPTALARLPVVPAAAGLHERFATASRSAGRPVPAAVAWLGTAVVGLATIGALAVALPRVGDGVSGETPVVSAERVTDTPAARQLATPGDDVPESGVEQLVVQVPERDTSETDSDSQDQAPDSQPAPEPEPSPEPTPEGDEEPAPEQPDEPEPSPEPENPLDLDLLDP